MSGGGSKQTVGYKYYVGMHQALCHGPVDKLVQIKVGGKQAYAGNCIGGSIYIDKEDLFGGKKREGGVSGQIDVAMGRPDQLVNDYLSSKLGTAYLPAFRGVVCAILRQVYIGLNPYIKDWGWRLQRIHTTGNGSVQWYDAKAEIGSYSVKDVSAATHEEAAAELNSYDITVPAGSLDGVFTVTSGGVRHDPTKQAVGTALAKWKGQAKWNVGKVTFSFTISKQVRGQDCAVLRFIDSNGNTVVTVYPYNGLNSGRPTIGRSGTPLYSTALEINRTYNVVLEQTSPTSATATLYDGASIIGSIAIPSILNVRTYQFGMIFIGGSFLDISSVAYGKVTIEMYQDIPGYEVAGTYADMNPAHIIRECLTDASWGMGYSEDDIDDASFMAAADILYNEGFGLSLLWNQQTSLEDFIGDILRHIDASLVVSLTTGKFQLKLIRGGYDTATLLVLDKSNIVSVEGFSRQTQAELVNEITVTYPSNESNQTETVTAQNLALIQQTGYVISSNAEYPGIANAALAVRVAARDLQALSTPLVSVTLHANRVAAVLTVGDVFIWNWQEQDADENTILTSYVMRVTEISYGNGVENTVRIQCVQDVFDLPTIAYVTSQPTSWVDPSDPSVLVPSDPNDPDSPLVPNPTAAPQPALPRLAWEAPYYDIALQLGDKGAQAAVSDGECFLAVAAGRQGQELNADILVDSGAGYDDGGVLDFCPYAYIRDAWEWNTLGGFVDKPTDMAAAIGRYASLGGEIVWIYDVSAANVVTVRRGCLDTIPCAHAAGTPLIVWHGFSTSDGVEYVNGDEVAVKIITATGGATLSESSAPVNTVTMEQRASRPYPPACVKIAGEWFPTEVPLFEGGIEISWRHRDRLLQTSTPTLDTVNASKWSADANIGPEPGVTYSARVLSLPGGVELAAVSGITGTTTVLAPSATGKVRLELWSVRNEYESFQKVVHEFLYGETVLWTPAEISGAVWIDADAVTLNGPTIASAMDKINGTITASQATASAQPTLVSAALNGTDVMQFDGGDWLSFGTQLGKPSNFTVFVVGMFPSVSATRYMCGAVRSDGATATAWGEVGVVATGKSQYQFGNDSTYRYGKTTNAVFAANEWFMSCQTYASGDSLPIMHINGTAQAVGTDSGTATACGGTAYEFSIGRLGAYTTNPLVAGSRVKAVLVASSVLSTSDRQKLEGYYAHLCGLTILLPSDHPYKSIPPMI